MRFSVRRAVGVVGAWMLMVGSSCGSDLEQPSQVTTLRILSVVASRPYVEPGQELTLSMTYHDALGPSPRPIQVTWIGGCLLPPGAPYYACFPQLEKTVAALAGDAAKEPFVHQEVASPERSGVPDAVSFSTKIPLELFDFFGGKKDASEDTADASEPLTAYVFFTACAGQVRPETADSEAKFPLGCFDEDGARVGPDSFVVGYTEVPIFEDAPVNENPPNDGIEFDGTRLGATPEDAPTVKRCLGGEARDGGCEGEKSECQLDIQAMVEDVAESDPIASAQTGEPEREGVWVEYFADGGELSDSSVVISDETGEYLQDHSAAWTPPDEAGIVSIWAVVRDTRGGASVARGFLRVE